MQHSTDDKDGRIDRRSFLQAAGAVAGTALATSALSYDRILGANDIGSTRGPYGVIAGR